MGLDMYLYKKEIEKDIDFENDDDRYLYWRGRHDLHRLFEMFSTRVEEGRYEFTKNDLLKMYLYLNEGVLNIFKGAASAHDEIYNLENKEMEDKTFFRECFVVVRNLEKIFEIELKNGNDYNLLNLFYECGGTESYNLMFALTKFLKSMKDDEKLVYIASY